MSKDLVQLGTAHEQSADHAAETYETDGPRCPYCQHLHTPDDELYFDEMRTELECGRCERVFEVDIFTQTSWTCTPREEQ